MIREALQFLQEQFAPLVQTVGGKTFANKAFTEINPRDPLPGQIDCTTLGALRDLILANIENITQAKQPMLHIVNHAEVRLLVGISDSDGRRQIFARATPAPYQGFKFNTYMSIEEFVVGLHAHFTPGPDRDYLIKFTSRVDDQAIHTSEDDGVSQNFTVKAGLSLKTTEDSRSRVTLAPFRTFPEVDQPASEFILRGTKTDKGVQLALIEADGGKWKVTAVENIAFRLRELGITLPIIA